MKIRKLLIVSAALIMILGLVVVVPVHAQVDFNSWKGKWFKGGEKNKGVLVDDSGTSTVVEKLPTYGFVQCWDDNTDTFTSILIQNDGTWGAIPFAAQVLGDVDPNPLDYVSYALITPTDSIPGIEALLVVLSVTGKEEDGEIAKGKVRTVGGAVIYNDDNPPGSIPPGSYFATSESLKMKMIPADKVPQEVIDACGVLCTPCL